MWRDAVLGAATGIFRRIVDLFKVAVQTVWRQSVRLWRWLKWVLYVAIPIAIAYLMFWPVPIDPYQWTPPENPGFSGPWAENSLLSHAVLLSEAKITGPEDLAFGPDGMLYTGLINGRIVRIDPENGQIELVANTGGVPLGVHFDNAGNLIVAVVGQGLMAVSPNGDLKVLTRKVAGQTLSYVDNLHVASDGVIWFSSPSQLFDLAEIRLDGMETRPTGRLLTYDPATNETKVVLDDLMFANGVTMPPDESYVLINEWYAYRIRRLWLTGPKAGTEEMFVENLPGYPDNSWIDEDGTVWVGLVIKRNAVVDWLHEHPFFMKMFARLPASFQTIPKPFGWLVGFDQQGNVIHNLQDPTGHFGRVTGAKRLGNKLYLSSNENTSIGIIDLPSN